MPEPEAVSGVPGSSPDRPLRLGPIPVQRVWGGDRLLSEIHAHLEAEGPIGETWEVSDVGDDPSLHSRVVGGPWTGRTLRELIVTDRDAVLGEAVPGIELPLLYKLIDAREDLSVQVHPADALVEELGLPGFGKTEAWVILDAAPGAEIIYGLEDSLSLHDYIEQARRGRGGEGFRRIPVRRGDVVLLPAGVLHAIGAGVLLAEIQQSSDITYRIHDWDRVGLDGRPRQLHLDEASRVAEPAEVPPCPLPSPPAAAGRFRLRIEAPPFALRELRGAAAGVPLPHVPGERFGILALLEGEATLTHAAGVERLRGGETLFLPAAAAGGLLDAEDVWLLWMQPGD